MSEQTTHPSDRLRFLRRFGAVVEHSPWVAEAVWERYPAAAREEEYEALTDAFGRAIRLSPGEQRLELLRAHPDLACGIVASHELSESSRSEQEGAGLDRCTPQEFIEFQSLNLEYRRKFGFPFILAVTGMTKKEILERFRDRIERSKADEFATAVENVIRIVGLRIADVLKKDD